MRKLANRALVLLMACFAINVQAATMVVFENETSEPVNIEINGDPVLWNNDEVSPGSTHRFGLDEGKVVYFQVGSLYSQECYFTGTNQINLTYPINFKDSIPDCSIARASKSGPATEAAKPNS